MPLLTFTALAALPSSGWSPSFLQWSASRTEVTFFVIKSAGLPFPSIFSNAARSSFFISCTHNGPIFTCRSLPAPFLFTIPSAALESANTVSLSFLPQSSKSAWTPRLRCWASGLSLFLQILGNYLSHQKKLSKTLSLPRRNYLSALCLALPFVRVLSRGTMADPPSAYGVHKILVCHLLDITF